jgi:DNA invertase Pin-like site-specific DNA recombinase
MGRRASTPMNPATKRLRVMGYVRVSTAEQAGSGAGLEAQRQTLAAAAELRGWDLIDVIADEGESGGKRHEKRRGLCAAIARSEAGDADALAVAKLDRLSRSVRDLADLAERSRPKGKRKGWGLILLDIDVDTSSPSGEFMVNVMGSAAQWERRIISQRTKDTLAIKRAQGVRLGRPSTLSRELVERIVCDRRAGATLTAIAESLAAEDIPTAQGGKWWPATVRKVLQGQDALAVPG